MATIGSTAWQTMKKKLGNIKFYMDPLSFTALENEIYNSLPAGAEIVNPNGIGGETGQAIVEGLPVTVSQTIRRKFLHNADIVANTPIVPAGATPSQTAFILADQMSLYDFDIVSWSDGASYYWKPNPSSDECYEVIVEAIAAPPTSQVVIVEPEPEPEPEPDPEVCLECCCCPCECDD